MNEFEKQNFTCDSVFSRGDLKDNVITIQLH